MLIRHGCAGRTSCRLDNTSHFSQNLSYLILPPGRNIISDRRYGACDGIMFVGGAIVLSVPRHATTDITLFSGNSCCSDLSMDGS